MGLPTSNMSFPILACLLMSSMLTCLPILGVLSIVNLNLTTGRHCYPSQSVLASAILSLLSVPLSHPSHCCHPM